MEDPAAGWLGVVLAVEPLWALHLFSKWFSSIFVQSDAGQGIQACWESLSKWRREGTRSGVRAWGGRPPEPAGAAWGKVQWILASVDLHLRFPLHEVHPGSGSEGLSVVHWKARSDIFPTPPIFFEGLLPLPRGRTRHSLVVFSLIWEQATII